MVLILIALHYVRKQIFTAFTVINVPTDCFMVLMWRRLFTWRGVPLNLSSLALDFFLFTPPCRIIIKFKQVKGSWPPEALPSDSGETWWLVLVWLCRSPEVNNKKQFHQKIIGISNIRHGISNIRYGIRISSIKSNPFTQMAIEYLIRCWVQGCWPVRLWCQRDWSTRVWFPEQHNCF